jgi:hypothetical protein
LNRKVQPPTWVGGRAIGLLENLVGCRLMISDPARVGKAGIVVLGQVIKVEVLIVDHVFAKSKSSVSKVPSMGTLSVWTSPDGIVRATSPK